MREIKFRAWIEDSKTMEKGLFGLRSDGKASFNKDAILMQFSGLKDKNGKEIYEGDMFVSPRVKAKDEYLGTVNFDDDLGCFLVNESNGGWSLLYNFMTDNKTAFIGGNIYENKELI